MWNQLQFRKSVKIRLSNSIVNKWNNDIFNSKNNTLPSVYGHCVVFDHTMGLVERRSYEMDTTHCDYFDLYHSFQCGVWYSEGKILEQFPRRKCSRDTDKFDWGMIDARPWFSTTKSTSHSCPNCGYEFSELLSNQTQDILWQVIKCVDSYFSFNGVCIGMKW